MSRYTQPPSGLQIAALRDKKLEAVNLMEPGSGTPWEDRGNAGVLKAFLQTCGMSLSNPRRLFRAIRRVGTSSDALWYAIGCGFVWGLSCLIHATLYFFYCKAESIRLKALKVKGWYEVDSQYFWRDWVIVSIIAVAATVLLLHLAARMFYALVSAEEMKTKAPPVLTFNVFAYCLGPSILALVPFIGPIVAVLWIPALMIVSGISRQNVSFTGSVICSLITFAACLGIVLAAAWILPKIWGLIVADSMPHFEPPKVRIRG
jgi:hypothetical protein